MNNIYDVLLNFNKYYYEFYEWKNSDNIENIRKIPFFKVNNKVYLNLKYRDVVIKKETLDLLKKKFSLLDGQVDDIRCLVTNGRECIGIVIDKNGHVIGRSAMLYEEEEEVLEEARKIKVTKIEFDYVGDRYDSSRLEIERKELLYNRSEEHTSELQSRE